MSYSMMTDSEILQDLARRFEARRISKRIKDTDLEAAVGISRKTLYNFRQGKTGISLRVFIRLLRGIGELERLEDLLESADASGKGYSPRQEARSRRSSAGKASRASGQTRRVRDKAVPDRDFSWGDER